MKKMLSIALISLISILSFSQTISLNFNTNDPTKTAVKYNVGYNTAGSLFNYDNFKSACASSALPTVGGGCGMPTKCILPGLIPKMDEVGVYYLRFPGGVPAMYYHFGQLNANGCSTNKNGWGVPNIGDPNDCQNNKNLNTGVIDMPNISTARNIIFDFIDMIKLYESQYGVKIKVLYVANLLTHFQCHPSNTFPQSLTTQPITGTLDLNPASSSFQVKLNETKNAIQLLKQYNIDVFGVELGNELASYLHNSTQSTSNGNGVTPQNYFDLAKNYATSLKASFPGIKTGLVINEKSFLTQGVNQYPYIWNTSIRTNVNSSVQNQNLFDAYIIHHYPTNTTGSEEAALTSTITVINNINAQMSHNGASQKKLWLTEWSNSFQQSTYRNKLGESMYTIDLLNKLQSDPILRNVVEVNCKQIFGNSDWSTGFAASTEAAIQHTRNATNDISLTNSGYALKLYKNLFLTGATTNGTPLYYQPNSGTGVYSALNGVSTTNVDNSKFRTYTYHTTIRNCMNQTVPYIMIYYTNYSNTTIVLNNIPTLQTNSGNINAYFILNKYMKSTGFTQSPTINSIDNTPIFEEYKYATNTNTTISVKPFSTGFIAVQFGPTELPTCVLRKKSDNNINEVKDIISQIVYPNPANSILNIDIKDDLLDSDFLLFSIDGRNVYSQKLSQNHQEIDIQKFAKGIYVYKITKNGISIDGKLVFSE
jgi:hypothetical protein